MGKTHKDVIWFTEVGVEYTHEKYDGASEFHYTWKHKPTGKRGESVIYGVSKEKGQWLVDFWNKSNPKIWGYATNLAKNILSYVKP